MIRIADHERIHRWQTFDASCDRCAALWPQNGTHRHDQGRTHWNVRKLREDGWFVSYGPDPTLVVCHDCALAALRDHP